MNQSTKNKALYLATTAMFSALLVGGKQALAVVPNVEVVTLFVALCAFVWGARVALPAVFVFIACDVAIWGVNTWVISYVLHWNAVALVFWLVGKIKLGKVATVVVVTIFAVALTALFGVTTSIVDTLVGYTGKGFFVVTEDFWQRFCVVYLAGTSFYLTHIACNALLFALAFLPLKNVNERAKMQFGL